MGKRETYERLKLIGEQSFQRLRDRLEEVEGMQVGFDTLVDILNLSEDELEYSFKAVKQLRSDLTRTEEISLLTHAMGSAMFCWNVLMAWTTLRRIQGQDYVMSTILYLLQWSKAQSTLSYMYRLEENGLLEISTKNWEEELEFNIHALQGCHDFFSSCFQYPSLFFAVQKWEEECYEGFSLRKSVQNTIGNYQSIKGELPFVPLLIGEAVFVRIAKAGALILEALATRKAEKIKEAKAHLQRVKDFLLRRGEPLSSLKRITTITERTPGLSQILFFLKVSESKNGKSTCDKHPGQSFVVTLPTNVAYYFNQPLSMKSRVSLHKEDLFRFILSSLPDDFEGIHKQIQTSTMARFLEEWVSFCDAFYWQRLDYITAKKNFTNYIVVKYHVGKEEAARICGLLKKRIEPEDIALAYAVIDIVLSGCIRKGEVDWETLRIIVVSGLLVKTVRWLKKRKS